MTEMESEISLHEEDLREFKVMKSTHPTTDSSSVPSSSSSASPFTDAHVVGVVDPVCLDIHSSNEIGKLLLLVTAPISSSNGTSWTSLHTKDGAAHATNGAAHANDGSDRLRFNWQVSLWADHRNSMKVFFVKSETSS
jgi:hypothetical protein